MIIREKKKKDWRDSMLAAIDRLSRYKGWSFGDTNPYFERVHNVMSNPKIKTRQQCKEECKKHGYR